MGKKRKGVRKASDSTIEFRFSFLGKQWVERFEGKPTGANLDKAEEFCQLIKQEIKNGSFDYDHVYATYFPKSNNLGKIKELDGKVGNGLTVKDYLFQYHSINSRKIEETSANENLRIIKKDWIPAIGKKQLSDLTWDDIETAALEWDNVTHTINNKLSALRPALEKAHSKNLVASNVLLGKSIEGVKRDFDPDDEGCDPFNTQEREDLFNVITGQDFNLFLFMVWTGIRPSELCVLKWNDILKPTPACPLGRVNINKSKPRKATKLKKPKTKSGKRKIKIFPDAYYALERQKDYTYLLREYIFHNPNTNEPWKVDKILEHWKVWCKKAGVTYRSPYQLRHTYATLMFMGNENAKWLSKQMGHSSPIQTLDLYGDWLDEDSPDSGMKAVAKFSKFGDFSNISSNIISQPL